MLHTLAVCQLSYRELTIPQHCVLLSAVLLCVDSNKVQLFMQMSSCSMLGAGLRVGATITIHNAHLLYLHGKLEGFGACIRTHCQVNTFTSAIVFCNT
jgi:hypothetical protein